MPKFVSTYSNLNAYNGLKRSLRGEFCVSKTIFSFAVSVSSAKTFRSVDGVNQIPN